MASKKKLIWIGAAVAAMSIYWTRQAIHRHQVNEITATGSEARSPGQSGRKLASAGGFLHDVQIPNAKQATLSDFASHYRNGKDNVFFDEQQFLSQFYGGDGRNIRKLSDELRSTTSLEALPETVSYALDKPAAMTNRMAMVTLLRGYYEFDIHPDARQAAHDTFVEVFHASIPRTLPAHVKKALVSEKYDILRILGRYDKDEALRLYQSASPALRKLLEPGLASGMRLAGIADIEITRLLAANQEASDR